MAARVCEVEGCERRGHGRKRYCAPHGWRLKVHGDVMARIPIGRMRHGVEMSRRVTAGDRWLAAQERAAAEERAELERIAYAPVPPAEGRGLLWLV